MNATSTFRISGRLLACLSVIVLGFTIPGNTQSGAWPVVPATPPPSAPSGAAAVEETPIAWFVELASPPAVEGTSLAVLRKEKEEFRAAARRAGLRYSERLAFDMLWNGLSLTIDPSQAGMLSGLPGVSAVYPVVRLTLPPRTLSEPQLATALAMTGADIAQSELGLSGAGIRVGIIDSGIDYQHRDLGGCFGPGCRVAYGWDFVGDGFPSLPPAPDPNPDDCLGHGTHVAGIVGANGAVKGVAPGVTFGAYRVFGCADGTYSDIMIAAMERALADKMHIVNMSIGAGYQWPQYPTAAASDRLANQGVVVVASIGNDATRGIWSASAPGVGRKVIGVASYDNTHANYPVFLVSPDDRQVVYYPASGSPILPPASGTMPMARTGTPSSTNDACAPLPAGSLAGQAALIRRGTCSFYIKVVNAQNAGAIAVVIYNNAPGAFTASVAPPALNPPVAIPVVSISGTDGGLIDGRIAGGPVTMTWTTAVVSVPNPSGGLISSFSSYGLAPDLSIKPDLGAPGGGIRSTVPIEQGGYAIYSGTSMSSPHVAGAAALLLQARPHTPVAAVRTILQNSADPKLWWGNPGLGILDNVHRQGAGMLDVDDAILATTTIEPAALALGESEWGPAVRTLHLENRGASSVTYILSHEPAVATLGTYPAGPSPFSFWSGAASVTFSPSSVTVAPGGTGAVNVVIAPNPGLPDLAQYGGYIVFTPQGGGKVYRVPFAGLKGDYQSIPVLTSAGVGFPWLAKLILGTYYQQSAGASFTMTGTDFPYFLLHNDHAVRRLRMEVRDANTGRAWHRFLENNYFRRNTYWNSFWAFGWDGITFNGKQALRVPDGQYVVVISIQKALGEDNNPAHWETWTSPMFIIDRP